MALALVPALALEQSQATRGGTVVLYTHESLSDHQLFVCVALRLAFFFLRPFLALCVASSMCADVLSWLLLWLLPRVVVTSPPKNRGCLAKRNETGTPRFLYAKCLAMTLR